MMRKRQLFYERFAVEDFSKPEMTRYAKRFSEEEKIIIKNIKQRNNTILKEYPKEYFMQEFQKHHTQNRSKKCFRLLKRYNLFKIMIPVAACVCIIWVSTFLINNNTKNVFRQKGELQTSLHIYRQTKTGYEELFPLSQVKEGDRLQFAYNNAGKRYGALFSIDGRKNVTFHFPDILTGSIELVRNNENKDVLLPFSYTLDNAPAFERFFFITSKVPFSLQDIITIIQNTSDIKTDDFKEIKQIEVETILLLKEDRTE